MNRKRFVGDWAMLGTVFGLILFGLLMIYSASNYTARLHMGNAFYYVERQIFTVLLGTAAMFLMMKLDYHRLLKMALPLYGLSLLLLAAVLLWGQPAMAKNAGFILVLLVFSRRNLLNLY